MYNFVHETVFVAVKRRVALLYLKDGHQRKLGLLDFGRSIRGKGQTKNNPSQNRESSEMIVREGRWLINL